MQVKFEFGSSPPSSRSGPRPPARRALSARFFGFHLRHVLKAVGNARMSAPAVCRADRDQDFVGAGRIRDLEGCRDEVRSLARFGLMDHGDGQERAGSRACVREAKKCGAVDRLAEHVAKAKRVDQCRAMLDLTVDTYGRRLAISFDAIGG